MGSLEEELQKMYDSEINVTITWLWDGGIDVGLGNEFAGFHEEGHVAMVTDVLPWLQNAIAKHYPESKYHVERMGGTWMPKWFGPKEYTVDEKLMRDIE